MGEYDMMDATLTIDKGQDVELLFAKAILKYTEERENSKKFQEQAQKFQEQAQKDRAENEEIKNTLFQLFGTFDLNEIKKMQESDSSKSTIK